MAPPPSGRASSDDAICVVSQCRYAFKRQSSKNFGSFFFFEMRPMISSFRPGGADSRSMSVVWRGPSSGVVWRGQSIVLTTLRFLYRFGLRSLQHGKEQGAKSVEGPSIVL